MYNIIIKIRIMYTYLCNGDLFTINLLFTNLSRNLKNINYVCV